MLDILVTPRFSVEEGKFIAAAATRLGISREKVVRLAVKSYAAQCVPTQQRRAPKRGLTTR